jgi:ABC-2 type transport system permease protein
MGKTMKNILRIASWEFKTKLKSKSFLLSTFVTPVIFLVVMTLPTYFIGYQQEVSAKLIGIIDLSGNNLTGDLQKELNRYYRLNNKTPEYMVYKISTAHSNVYNQMLSQYKAIESKRDSIHLGYAQIKNRRTEYYRNQATPNREYLLRNSYKKLQESREEKELVDIELERFKVALDSAYKKAAVSMADSLLKTNVLNSYLVFASDFANSGKMQYHSANSGNFLELERFEKILQNIIYKKRMLDDKIERSQISRWLRPVYIQKYRQTGHTRTEWDFYAQFYGPLIGLFLLSIAIFTTSGFLFGSVLSEKSNKILETLLSFVSGGQLITGKILGMGLLGLLQIFLWFAVVVFLMAAEVIPIHKITYLTGTNFLYFIIYYLFGYLFYGAIFIAAGAMSNNEYDTRQIKQILKLAVIFPALLSLMALTEPNSTFIRALAYFPFFSPSLMIMRIPLSSESILMDIYITVGILLLFSILALHIATRIFKTAALLRRKRLSLAHIFSRLKF